MSKRTKGKFSFMPALVMGFSSIPVSTLGANVKERSTNEAISSNTTQALLNDGAKYRARYDVSWTKGNTDIHDTVITNNVLISYKVFFGINTNACLNDISAALLRTAKTRINFRKQLKLQIVRNGGEPIVGQQKTNIRANLAFIF